MLISLGADIQQRVHYRFQSPGQSANPPAEFCARLTLDFQAREISTEDKMLLLAK